MELKQYNNKYINICFKENVIARSLYNIPNIVVVYKHQGQIYCNTAYGYSKQIKVLLKKYLMIYRLLEFNILNVIFTENELYLIGAYSKNKEIGIFNEEELKLLSKIMRMPIKEKT